jgi:ubiquinone/menaquinone biosynthesis C-methylase UbiE
MASLLHRIIDYPPILDTFRKIVEANFRAEKDVIRKELLGHEGKILDLPCGTGIFSPLFPDATYTGIDLGEHYVLRARKQFPKKKFLVGSALHLQFPDKSFDSVLTIGFLHHLDPPEVLKSLSEIHRILKPGGTFLLIEDRPVSAKWNIVGKFLQSLDAGGRIREMEYYEKLLREKFTVKKSYPLRAGVWEYGVFVSEK